jgi:hypothetical protein
MMLCSCWRKENPNENGLADYFQKKIIKPEMQTCVWCSSFPLQFGSLVAAL